MGFVSRSGADHPTANGNCIRRNTSPALAKSPAAATRRTRSRRRAAVQLPLQRQIDATPVVARFQPRQAAVINGVEALHGAQVQMDDHGVLPHGVSEHVLPGGQVSCNV